MANNNEEILLKLKIQTDKANAALKKTEVEIKKTIQSFRGLTKGSLDYQAAQAKLANQQATLAQQSAKYNNALKIQTAAQSSAVKQTQQLRSASGGATTSVLELGRVVSDAPYGIRGMANNVSQLASNMLFTSQQIDETTGKAIGFNGVLKDMSKVFMGPLGILFVIQGAVAALDYFYGAAKKAEKSISDLTSKTYAGSLVAKGYVEELENVNISEDRRAVVTQELIKLVPTLTEADLKYGANLDKVRLKIKSYALAQASRIQIDNLVQENSEVLAAKNELESIKQIENSEERLERMKKFILETGADISGFYLGFGQEGLINKGNVDATEEEFERLGRIIDKESEPIIKRISELTTALKLDPDKEEKPKKPSPFKAPKDFDKEAEDYLDQISKLDEKIEILNAETQAAKIIIQRRYHLDDLRRKDEENRDEYKKEVEAHKAKLKLFLDDQVARGKMSQSDADGRLSTFDNNVKAELAEMDKNFPILLRKWETYYDQKISLAKEKEMMGAKVPKGDSDDGKTDLQRKLEEKMFYAEQFMMVQQSLTNFLDGEFQRELTMEQNKTNAINNELRERLNNENLSAGERKNIQLKIARNDEELRKKQEKIEKKRFKMQKAANISQAVISTYLAANKVLVETKGGTVARFVAMAATISAGLLNVAAISRQKFQSSAGATSTAGALGGGGSGGGNDRSFNFNLAGASQENQLAQTLQGRFNQPLQAYVVSRDITNQQQLDEEITSSASFG
jgi:hypothetical protein